MNEVLKLRNVSVGYGRRTVLANVTFDVRPGEIIVLMGKSGSGKTTLLNAILGLIQHEGSIEVAEEQLTHRSRTRVRRDLLGVVFQDHQLIDELSPAENVAISAMIQGIERSVSFGKARSLLAELGVPDQRDSVTELSGGEKQRTALARALVKNPALLVADEPTASLDQGTKDEVSSLMISRCRTSGCGLIIATHDVEIAAEADRILLAEDGVVSLMSEVSSA